MYGKIFESIYEGSLYGHFEATVTFQALIVLADKDGFVDMTPQAITGRTGYPADVINKGLEELVKPDPLSRSPDDEGRRLVPIDPERAWGWKIVNYMHYRDKGGSLEARRKADAERQKRKREAEKMSRDNNVMSQDCHGESAHTDTDTDTDTDKSNARFKRPKVEEIKECMLGRGCSDAFANAQSIKFFNYYETVGWKVGRTKKPMVSWKHSVTGWLDRAGPEPERNPTVAELRAQGKL